MAKDQEFEFEEFDPSFVDEATLTEIDESIREADAGQLIPIEEVRKLLPQWITNSSSPQKRTLTCLG